MKMSVGVLMPSNNNEIDKLDETLQLLSKVALSLRTSDDADNFTISKNQNHNNGSRNVVAPRSTSHRSANSAKDPDVSYSCVHKIRRGGRVAKKWPSRQGYPGSRPGYPPQSSGSIYQPTAAQPGMYPTPRSRVPAVPPKNPLKIMTPEELANYEAQAKLQQRQMEEYNRERLLAQQRNQQREDEKWIEEQMLSPDNPPTNGEEVDDEDPEHLYSSADEVRRARASVRADVPPPPNMPPAKPPRNQPAKDTIAPAPPTASFEEVKPTPTMQLDREGDNIFRDTMSVVKSVLHTNSKTMDAQPDEIVELVKSMGKALKQLCTSLDQEMPSLDEQFHREIDMAQKTTNKDLSQIINQMKLVKKFYVTTQVSNYKKNFMAANQVLAMDAKNLLDVIDKARIHKLEAEHAARPERYEAEEEAESETLPPPPSDLLEQG